MSIGIFWIACLVFITIVCLIPFGISLSYFILGVRLLISGKREKSSIKTSSGYKSILFSVIAMVVIYFLWQWLYWNLLGWEE
jgi:hypothetical protein